jgi:hypothetical protein
MFWLKLLLKAKWVKRDVNDKGGANSCEDWHGRPTDDRGYRLERKPNRRMGFHSCWPIAAHSQSFLRATWGLDSKQQSNRRPDDGNHKMMGCPN